MKNNRVYWIDCLRGIMIILVILGHSVQNNILDLNNNHLFNIIYSFHMPLFMMLSGFVSYKEKLKWQTVKTRSIQLLIPFFAWQLLWCLINGEPNVLKRFYDVILNPDISYWFLYVLFWIVLFFHVGDYFATKFRIKQEYIILSFTFLFVFGMVVLDFRILGFQFVAWYFIFYALGFYFNKYKKFVSIKNKYILLIIGIIWFIGSWFWKIKTTPYFLDNIFPQFNSLFLYAYKFIVAIMAIPFFYNISPKIFRKENPVFNQLAVFGKNSLGLYVVHMFIILYVTNILEIFLVDNSNLLVISLAFIVLYISYFIILLLNSNKMLSFLFLGNNLFKTKIKSTI